MSRWYDSRRFTQLAENNVEFSRMVEMVAALSRDLKYTHRRFLEEAAAKWHATVSEINRLYSTEAETALQNESKLLRSANEVL